MTVIGFSHIGLSVRDAARSAAFYSAAFGFEVGQRFDLSEGFERAGDAPPLPSVCQFVTRGPIALALIQYRSPKGSPVPRPMHQLGIANMGIIVEAIEPVAELVEAYGGRVHRETLLNGPNGTFLHCSDPDGARIELMTSR